MTGTNGTHRWTHEIVKWGLAVALSATVGFWGGQLKESAERMVLANKVTLVEQRVGSLETVVDGLARINCNELVDPNSRWRYNICDKIPARLHPTDRRSR